MKTPLLLSLGFLLLVGCGMSTVGMKCTISGGEEKVFMLGEAGPEKATDGRVSVIGVMAGPISETKEIFYEAQLTVLKGAPAIKSIRVDNVSDPESEFILQDDAPKFAEGGLWKMSSPKYDPKGARFTWLYHEGNTPRVFKFTITYADGKVSELYQLSIIPSFVKEFMRKLLGL